MDQAASPRNRLSRLDRAYLHTGRGRPSKAFQSPEGWNRASCTRAFSQHRLAQRLTKFHSVPRPGNQSRRWSQAYLQIDASLFSPSVSPKISMVSASTSVNAGVGPRLRRRVSPRICRTASSITQYSQTRRRSRSMDGPPQGSEALENVPHRPILRGRLVEVIQSPSLNPWETRGSGFYRFHNFQSPRHAFTVMHIPRG